MLSASEFNRNRWIEITPARLGIAPLIAALLFALQEIAHGPMEWTPHGILAFWLAFVTLITTLWGSKLSVESLSDEVNQGSWVFQKMAGLSAWEMSLGKLLGSTLYVWYCYGILFIPYAATVALYEPMKWHLWALAYVGVGMVGLCTQACGLVFCLWSLRHQGNPRARLRPQFYLLAVFVAWWVVGAFTSHILDTEIRIKWHGWSIPLFGYDWGLICYATFWSLLGCWRLMRRELQQQNTPLWWLAFMLALPFIIDISNPFFMLYLLFGGFSALDLLSSPANLIPLRQTIRYARLHQVKAFLIHAPLWFWGALLMFPLSFIVLLPHPPLDGKLGLALLAGTLFFYRDIAVVLLIKTSTSRKPVLLIFVYFVLAYLLLPPLLNLSGAKVLAQLFLPIPGTGVPVGIPLAASFVQAGFALFWFVRNRPALFAKSVNS